MLKRFLCMFCSLAILFSLLFIPIYAADEIETGKLGDNITYTWNKTTGQIVIQGTGKMPGFGTLDFDSPFCGSLDVRDVSIESGITNVSSSLFSQCKNLQRISIPNTVEVIGDHAFSGCESLQEIAIPNSVVQIGEGAFGRCTSLKEIAIPKSVTLIWQMAFWRCSNLTDVYFYGPMPEFQNDAPAPRNSSLVSAKSVSSGLEGLYSPFAESSQEIRLYHMADPAWPTEPFVIDGTVPKSGAVSGVTVLTNCIPVLVASDVPANAWYASDMMQTYQLGLMNGVSAQTFAPQQATTRGMLITMLHRMAGEPKAAQPAPFPDTAARYYSDAIDWAAEIGLAKGCPDGTFAPDAPITREQLAVFLWRYAQYLRSETQADPAALDFPDANAVHGYAAQAMAWAVETGLIRGAGSDVPLLLPQGSATRAQVAAVLVRFLAE